MIGVVVVGLAEVGGGKRVMLDRGLSTSAGSLSVVGAPAGVAMESGRAEKPAAATKACVAVSGVLGTNAWNPLFGLSVYDDFGRISVSKLLLTKVADEAPETCLVSGAFSMLRRLLTSSETGRCFSDGMSTFSNIESGRS